MSTGHHQKDSGFGVAQLYSFYLYRRTGHLRCLAGTSDFV